MFFLYLFYVLRKTTTPKEKTKTNIPNPRPLACINTQNPTLFIIPCSLSLYKQHHAPPISPPSLPPKASPYHTPALEIFRT